jgi:hypothetical protein
MLRRLPSMNAAARDCFDRRAKQSRQSGRLLSMDRPLDLVKATRSKAAATKPAACERDTINAIHLRMDGNRIKFQSHHTVTSYYMVSRLLDP